MQYNHELDHKFQKLYAQQNIQKKPPVSSSLTHFLTRQSSRIKSLLAKKQAQQSKIYKLSTDSLKYRSYLKNSIDQSQMKHQKNRQQFLKKRSKQQNFKISEVQRKRSELLGHRKQLSKKNQAIFKKHKQDTIEFWKNKSQSQRSLYQKQASAPSLYQRALNNKRNLWSRSQLKGKIAADEMFTRHDKIRQKMGYLVRQNQEHLDEHNSQIQQNLQRNQRLMKQRQQQFINKIGTSQYKSVQLQKAHTIAWQKKVKGKRYDDFEAYQKTRQNFNTNFKKRSQSLKNCHCLKKVKSVEASMKTSSVFYPKVKQIQNQEQLANFNSKAYRTMNNFSVVSQRQQFMKTTSLMKNSVMRNKQFLRQKQAAKDQKKTMIQRQISQALKTKDRIMNQSNNYVRQARIQA